VDDILTDKKIGDFYPLRENLSKNLHPGLGLVIHPPNVLRNKIVSLFDLILLIEGRQSVQDLALEGIGDHRIVMNRGDHFISAVPQSQNDPFQLPRGGVGTEEREMPGDIILQDRFPVFGQEMLQSG
jgi:hypothetical protein